MVVTKQLERDQLTSLSTQAFKPSRLHTLKPTQAPVSHITERHTQTKTHKMVQVITLPMDGGYKPRGNLVFEGGQSTNDASGIYFTQVY